MRRKQKGLFQYNRIRSGECRFQMHEPFQSERFNIHLHHCNQYDKMDFSAIFANPLCIILWINILFCKHVNEGARWCTKTVFVFVQKIQITSLYRLGWHFHNLGILEHGNEIIYPEIPQGHDSRWFFLKTNKNGLNYFEIRRQKKKRLKQTTY